MQFKVFYTFRAPGGHITRGGEVVIEAQSSEQAIEIFNQRSQDWYERKTDTVSVNAHRILSEYVMYASVVRDLARLPEAEWLELIDEVRKQRLANETSE